MIRKPLMQGLCGLLALILLGCSSADNEMAGGNIQAVNHTLSAINWLSVNGYRADGGGGRSCCIIMPIKWRPGLKANVEWEVDPDPFAKLPPLGTREFKAAMAKAESSFQRHRATVDIPEWPGTESCDLKVHFLTCNRVKITTSCWGHGSPNNPIKEPMGMKEPAVCPK
ncbi:DUF3304 domain-containing protein [Pseudomonas syringae pv. actinidiae]|uniref:DUF3304 domain-containing protein n=1 Tax=Pseudomonas syringae TaxID=317 RepID=UPI000BB556BF|nr:DUF3304 domain-containing protein [Pseudomonas syringae]PBK54716.1 hypothetical protein BUE60_09200 [Pseudomonas syringae pv. actinidiae]PBK57305.1 hypothetical protein BUE61_03025 [Pseudomonas syringae pv. actinidiae]RJX52727.1 DUF3304 domain-containing protein [Pseudomonas syringae pv. actinidiae]RJX60743.1 DUF3304 domain-containing protein [Pseudomonas syringae pv. actinidiae]RJX62232.1 DUF3304 domain-containing protein [Pseudomonas syringae pv. actinidiae]